jgi:hypothetical protein
MRGRIMIGLMLLVAVFSVLAGAQVVLTDDANTSSLSPKTNYGSSIALIVGSGSNTYLKFSFANLGPGVRGETGLTNFLMCSAGICVGSLCRAEAHFPVLAMSVV